MRSTTPTTDHAWLTIFGAWTVALCSSLGAIFVGEVMGQLPCDLCWYQRAFMFPLVLVLAVAAYRSDASGVEYALPLAAAGWLVAGFHNLVYFGIVPTEIRPCGPGPSCSGDGMTLAGTLPLPALSLAAFTLITVLLLVACRRTSQ